MHGGKTTIKFDAGLTSAYEPINPRPGTSACSDPENCFTARAAYETAKGFTATR